MAGGREQWRAVNCLALGVCAALILVASAHAQVEWRTYRNTDYRFRVTYPPDWDVRTPRGPNVRVLLASGSSASSQYPANCNVVVRALPELRGVTQKQIDAELAAFTRDDWLTLLGDKGADMGAKLVEFRPAKIDNRQAQFAIVEFKYETVTAVAWFRAMNVVTFTPGYFWHLTCGAGGSTTEDMQKAYRYWTPTLNRIVNTFVFEQ